MVPDLCYLVVLRPVWELVLTLMKIKLVEFTTTPHRIGNRKSSWSGLKFKKATMKYVDLTLDWLATYVLSQSVQRMHWKLVKHAWPVPGILHSFWVISLTMVASWARLPWWGKQLSGKLWKRTARDELYCHQVISRSDCSIRVIWSLVGLNQDIAIRI